MDWDRVLDFALGSGLVALVGGGLMLWKKFRTDQQDVERGAIDLADKQAEYQAREELRIIEHWRGLNAELKAQMTAVIDKLTLRQDAMSLELEKRQRDHDECKQSDAVNKARIEHLTIQLADKADQIKELRQRVDQLEKKAGP